MTISEDGVVRGEELAECLWFGQTVGLGLVTFASATSLHRLAFLTNDAIWILREVREDVVFANRRCTSPLQSKFAPPPLRHVSCLRFRGATRLDRNGGVKNILFASSFQNAILAFRSVAYLN